MMLYALDTNTFGPLVIGDPTVIAHISSLAPTDELAVPVITAEEALRGRLAQIRRAQAKDEARLGQVLHWLVVTLQVLGDVYILPYDEAAQKEFARLKALRLPGLGIQDLRIAAIARAAGAVLVTVEAAFKNIPSLMVEDWTQPRTP
ncbi:MAG: PIN domain-containing protein [Acidobacteria bacterium]|nr:PIN domain-containing protein [Acidobacteriota bacterium]